MAVRDSPGLDLDLAAPEIPKFLGRQHHAIEIDNAHSRGCMSKLSIPRVTGLKPPKGSNRIENSPD